jgi:putative endonuclease
MKQGQTPGEIAEQKACIFLRENGLSIRTRNYRTRQGEIDIIAEQDDLLIFVEVRLRNNIAFGGAEESITSQKQRRILRASQHYLQKEKINDTRPCRFDAICLTNANNLKLIDVRWIKDAFGNPGTW